MTKTNIDYSKTIIYKIVCNDLNVKEIYVGHTTDFTKRKNHHKHSCNSGNTKRSVYEYIRQNGGWMNWSMLEIEKYSCKDGNEARTRERHWIETLKANLNCTIPIRTEIELELYPYIYRELNKEKIEAYKLKNKEKIKQTEAEYKKNNIEKIKVMQKLYRENNIESVKEAEKNYRNNNKELIKEKKRQYYLLNKEKINETRTKPYICECGSTTTLGDKAKHFKSKKHQSFCVQIN